MGIDSIEIPSAVQIRESADPVKEEDRLPGMGDGPLSIGDQEKLQNIEDKKADRALRKDYAQKAFEFAWVGFGFWASILAFYAFIFLCSGDRVFSDAVLITITSATTVNLFAAFIGVVRGLFPAAGKHDKYSAHK